MINFDCAFQRWVALGKHRHRKFRIVSIVNLIQGNSGKEP